MTTKLCMRDDNGYEAEMLVDYVVGAEEDQPYDYCGDPGTKGSVTITVKSYTINPEECDPEFKTTKDKIAEYMEAWGIGIEE